MTGSGPGTAPGSRAEQASRELTARAGAIAARVAALLRSLGSTAPEAPGTIAFLESFALVAAAGRPGPSGPHPLDRLAARYGLEPVEVDLILLAGLPDEHEGLAAAFRELHPRGEPRPTVGLAAQLCIGAAGVAGPLVGGDARAAVRRLLAVGRAVRGGILLATETGPLPERSLLLADGLWEALHGVATGGPAWLETVAAPRPPGGLDGWLAWPRVRRAVAALSGAQDRTIVVDGEDELVALSRVAALSEHGGVPVMVCRARVAGPDRTRAVAALAAARGAVPVLVVEVETDGHPSRPPTLELGDLPGPVVVVAPSGVVRHAAGRPILVVPTGPLDDAARRAAWRAALPELDSHTGLVAARHDLDPALIAEVAEDVRGVARLDAGRGTADAVLAGDVLAAGTEPTGDDPAGPADPAGVLAEISAIIRMRAGLVLPAGVRLVEPSAGWDRLILPDDRVTALREAVDRLRHQATVLDEWGMRRAARATRGVRVLLTGPPGTGKSLTAEVLARAAGTDLLAVDLASVVSKWIGETEKNLAAVFDAAERAHAVLFFDEADALFGRRTEVSDAHDRYANLETAYLLTRLDRFEGLTVLASNLRRNIDPAFIRRLDVVVDLELPGTDERERLWHAHLPATVPVATDVAPRVLATRYAVPGAWIRNAAIAAAFRAAAGERAVRQGDLVAAMRREFDKVGKPFPGPGPEATSRPRSDGSRSERRHP